MKKSVITIVVIVILIIIGILVFGKPSGPNSGTDQNASSTLPASTPIPSSETTKVSSKTSLYKNDELGFSVNYPTAWEKAENDTGVSFIMPIDQTQVSTIAKLQVDISVSSSKCSFPPVTTIKDRGTLAVAGQTANMISMTNTVQGRAYFNRMYSLQKGDICYTFAYSSVAQSPSSKNLTGSNLTQAQNNNKAITNTADAAFTDMVKSFAFVTGPAGKDETQASPAK